ncbi:MAG: hypothetical protein KDA45_06130 [Planctomycetales bacterium]|nr:hypothetical protein [Planctomycetales bacterium]
MRRGIFAIEGEWRSDLRQGLSFRPIIELLSTLDGRISFVHRDAATRAELFYYLDKWTQKRYSRYPILYLGYHGVQESILIGDGRSRDRTLSLQELAKQLEGRCAERIIYLGSCETMNMDGRKLQSFLKQTGALAVCGYREQVNMLRSAAFELLLFHALMQNSLTIQGTRATERSIQRDEKPLCRDLGFRMVVRTAS